MRLVKLEHSSAAPHSIKDPYFAERDYRGISYSWRSAIIGSTLMARRAGMQQAATATSVSETATAAKVSGSVGLTPNRRLLMKRVSASEVPRPMATPARVSFNPWETTSRRMPFGAAPRAMRMPISRVCCETM